MVKRQGRIQQVFSFIVAAAMIGGYAGASYADAGAGKKVFKSKKCGGCHITAGPAKEKTIKDQLAKKGPELWYAGSKFKKEWLGQWLQNPQPIRPLAYNSISKKNAGKHAKLSAGDAASVTDYLMGLKSSEVKPVEIKVKKKNIKGKKIFTKTMPCSGCHQYTKRKKLAGGLTGPTLIGAKDRLQSDWIYAYLNNTKVFKPVRMMPVFSGLMKDSKIKEVTAFIINDFK